MAEFVKGYGCLDCKQYFKKSPIFSLLKKDELDMLNDTSMEVSFKKGEIMYKQGSPLTHIVIIHKGFGKIYLEGFNVRNLILTYTKKYDLNGGVGVFIDLRHHSTLMAVTDCEACFIEIKAFTSVLKGNSIFMDAYMKQFAERVRHAYQQLSVLTQKNMEGRMAESILYLNNHTISNGIIKNVTKQDLAELTAMTKESAIRVLKEFKVDGLIEFIGHDINILNKKGLEQVALYG